MPQYRDTCEHRGALKRPTPRTRLLPQCAKSCTNPASAPCGISAKTLETSDIDRYHRRNKQQLLAVLQNCDGVQLKPATASPKPSPQKRRRRVYAPNGSTTLPLRVSRTLLTSKEHHHEPMPYKICDANFGNCVAAYAAGTGLGTVGQVGGGWASKISQRFVHLVTTKLPHRQELAECRKPPTYVPNTSTPANLQKVALPAALYPHFTGNCLAHKILPSNPRQLARQRGHARTCINIRK